MHAEPSAADRLQLLLESTGEGIFGVDTDGRCTFVNLAAAQTLGWRTEQVLGQNMHALTHHLHADGRHDPECDCPIFNAFLRGLPCRIVNGGAGGAELLAKCQAMGRLIDTAVGNVGRIITDLRPSILDHQGLWAVLEWQAQEFIDAFSEAGELHANLKCHVAAGVQPAEGGLAIANEESP